MAIISPGSVSDNLYYMVAQLFDDLLGIFGR